MSDPRKVTSIHVRNAIEGEDEAIAWIITRFEGMVRAHARHRLATAGMSEDDLVQEVWARVIPRLGSIEARDGRMTPVLVRYICSVAANVCQESRRHAGRRNSLDAMTIVVTGQSSRSAMTRMIDREHADGVLNAIAALEETDRTVLMMRLVEDVPIEAVAEKLGISASATTRRYQKALARLKTSLKDSLFDDIEAS